MGARLTLDIAESDIVDFLRVLPLRGRTLRVTLADVQETEKIGKENA
jgi:hypothetical protein